MGQWSGRNGIAVLALFGAVSVVPALAAASVPTASPDPSAAPPAPIAWWPANGDTIDKISGAAAPTVGTVVYWPAALGEGFFFNGGANAVVPPPAALPITRALTISAWVELFTLQPGKPVTLLGASQPGLEPAPFALTVSSVKQGEAIARFEVASAQPGAPAVQAAVSANVPLRQFFFIAATFDGTGKLRLFLNGDPAAAAQSNLAIPGSNKPAVQTRISIGSDGPGAPTGQPLHGILCDLRLYNQALSPDAIQALDSERAAPSLSELARWANSYQTLADSAVSDLLKHFWVGGDAGHLLDTAHGFGGAIQTPDQRGILWERATMMSALSAYERLTRTPAIRDRINSDWRRERTRFSETELTSCGDGSQKPACDDAGWTATMYFNIYEATRDPAALRCAAELFNAACARWSDAAMGGGMWYNDKREYKASVQAALILVGVRLYEINRQPVYWKKAATLYTWAESHLRREDGLYWCVDLPSGPQQFPDPPREAASDTFLAANMAMNIIQARMYRDTHNEVYLRQALDTARAITTHETDGRGAFMDDRDAWANGYFMSDWVREALTLPGIDPTAAQTIRRTALAIWSRDRTPQGYYGGCWDGPLSGKGCPWDRPAPLKQAPGQVFDAIAPEQIMTSSSAASVIVAAALLDRLKL